MCVSVCVCRWVGGWVWGIFELKYSYTFQCWTSQGVLITEMLGVPQGCSFVNMRNPVKTLHAAAD